MATLGGLEEVGARDQQSENEVYDSPRPLVAGPHLLASWPPAQRQGRDSGWHGGASRPRGRPAPAGERPNLSRGKKPEVCLSVPFTWPQGHFCLDTNTVAKSSAPCVPLPAVCSCTHLAGAGP